MLEDIKYLPINWADGMKVSKEHFIGEEYAFIDLVRDSLNVRLNDYNFGLLPPTEQLKDGHSIDINGDTIQVNFCRGITRGGARIEVLKPGEEGLRMPTHQLLGGNRLPASSEWLVLLRIDIFQRLPVGQPNPAESPLRYPFTSAGYQLEIVSADQLNSSKNAGFVLPLAKLQGGNQGFQPIHNYIPPCTNIESSQDLIRVYRQYETLLKDIEENAFEVINKVRFKRKRKEVNAIAEDIDLLARNIVEYLSRTFDAYRLRYAQLPPLFMIEYIVKIARIFRTSLRLMNERESLMEYFRHYVESFQASVLEENIDGLCSLNYNHFDIRQSLDRTDRFLGVLKDLFGRLVELDYQRLARPDIVTSEGIIRNQPTNTSSPPSSRGGNSGGSINIKSPQKDKGWNLK